MLAAETRFVAFLATLWRVVRDFAEDPAMAVPVRPWMALTVPMCGSEPPLLALLASRLRLLRVVAAWPCSVLAGDVEQAGCLLHAARLGDGGQRAQLMELHEGSPRNDPQSACGKPPF